jgi:glucose/arabinose dehydrogenase
MKLLSFLALVALSGIGAAQSGSLQTFGNEKALENVLVASGFTRPIALTSPPGDFDRLFVTEQDGAIRIVKDGSVLPTPFLDLSALTLSPSDGGSHWERGLLSLVFHPNYASNGFFFVNYTTNAGDTVIARYTVSGDEDIADPASAQIFLTAAQPYRNHNGGTLLFKPGDSNNYLYITLGDGGSGNDPEDNGQDLTSKLGKILRVDVDAGPPADPANPNTPGDNPFEDGAGPNEDSIWAYGLRNPYRVSFDRQTGDLYIGDVGQVALEEISFQAANSVGGENYGWSIFEGTRCNTDAAGRVVTQQDCDDLAGHIPPIYEYGRSDGVAVIGGYVYRGSAIPSLQGHYFFADNGTGRIWSFVYDGATVTDFVERTGEAAPAGMSISSFGEDAAGELYVVDLGGGAVYRIIDPHAPVTFSNGNGSGVAEEGDRVELSFEVTSSSEQVSLRWLKDSNAISTDDSILDVNSEMLVIDPVRLSDSGTYELEVDTGTKAVVLSPALVLQVVAVGAVPAVGVFGLAVIASGFLIVGTVAVRRRRPGN